MENNKLEGISEEVLEAISGGSREETQELLDWCNRHGAGITDTIDNRYVAASIFYFLCSTYPELRLENGCISTGDAPNLISGMRHNELMSLLRSTYGD